jgi:pyruvate formate-lyase activating enzyme-like uncharacterized protein
MTGTEHEKNFHKVLDGLNKLKHDFNSNFHCHFYHNNGEVKKEELESAVTSLFDQIKDILGSY